jgi:hypothetical protein
VWSLTACRRRAMSFQLMGELEGADCACTRAHTANVTRDANGAGWYESGGRAWWRERTLAPHRTVPAISVNEPWFPLGAPWGPSSTRKLAEYLEQLAPWAAVTQKRGFMAFFRPRPLPVRPTDRTLASRGDRARCG